jgi:hypothetical protein
LRFRLGPVSRIEIAALVSIGFATLVYFGVARVTVRNTSAIPLSSVNVSGNGFTRTVATLSPGAAHTFWFVPESDTALRVAFRAGDRSIDCGDHGYYAAPPHPQIPGTVTIHPDLRTDFRHARLRSSNNGSD